MTASVTLRIPPSGSYTHVITFEGVTVPSGAWVAMVSSLGGRSLLSIDVEKTDTRELTLTAEPATLLTGTVRWSLTDADGDLWLSGPVVISFDASGTEATTVPEGAATAVTVQGIAVEGGGGGGDGISEEDAQGLIDDSITAHVGAANPHAIYLTQAEGDALYDDAGTAAAAVTAHEGASDPHPTYQTQTEGDARYLRPTTGTTLTDPDIPAAIARDSEVTSAISTHAGATDPHADRAYTDTAISTHAGAANPHPTYLTQAEGDAAYDAAGAAAAEASARATAISGAITTHAGATDPHGDRAFATSAVGALSSVYQPKDTDLDAWAGKTAPSGAAVGTTDTQTLTNKTLTAPVVNSPTGIAKGDVGLGNVDNTADTAKPVSTAQQTALNLKANLASPALTGTPTVPTASPATNNTQAASTAYADAAVAAGGGGGSTSIVRNVQTGSSYTLAATDAGKMVATTNSAGCIITVPLNSTVAIPNDWYCWISHECAVGITGITPEGGVTIDAPLGSLTFRFRYGRALLHKKATNVWAISGDLILPDKGFVNHGSVAATARPEGYLSIEWFGTVQPNNWISGDTWIDPS